MVKIKRNLSKKEWNLLIICIIIMVVLLADFAFRRTCLRLSRLREEIGLKEAELVRLNRILSQREKIESGYKEIIVGLQQIRTSEGLLEKIENVAKGVGLNIRNIKPMATKDEDLYKIYSVRVEAQDDILTLAKFLNTFTEERKAIGVNRLEINVQDRKELPRVSIMISAAGLKE